MLFQSGFEKYAPIIKSSSRKAWKISFVIFAFGLELNGHSLSVILYSVCFVSNILKPSWCLVVKTTYLIPASFAAFDHFTGSNSVGLKVFFNPSYLILYSL